MSGEQGEQQTYPVPYLHAKRLADADELAGGGVGVDDDQVHPTPWMAGQGAVSLVGDVFQASFAKVGSRIVFATLHDRLDDGDAHRFSEGTQFRRVFHTPDQ